MCVYNTPLVNYFRGLGLTCPYSSYVQFCAVSASSDRCADHDPPQVHFVLLAFIFRYLSDFVCGATAVMSLVLMHGQRRRPWGEPLPSGVGGDGELLAAFSPLWLVLRYLSDSVSMVSRDWPSHSL